MRSARLITSLYARRADQIAPTWQSNSEAMQWTQNSCICGSSRGTPTWRACDYNFKTTDRLSKFVRCLDCGSLYPEIFPTSDSLHQAYLEYYTASPVRQSQTSGIRRLGEALRFDYMRGHTPSGASTVLDYGCGSGAFLVRESVRHDVKLFGTDVSKPRDQLALTAFEWLDMRELGMAGSRRFDWVTLNHVLEHIPDPVSSLAVIARSLAEKGGVWIATPNSNSWLHAIFGEWARDLDFPRHRVICSRLALEEALAKQGLAATFHAPPRINAALNWLSCWRNARTATIVSRGLLALLGLPVLMWSFIAPRAWHLRYAPELTLTATSLHTSISVNAGELTGDVSGEAG
jgi:SAM-dependent methyltransferase